jgi:hypothetical protein
MFCVGDTAHCPGGHDHRYVPLITDGRVVAAPRSTRPGVAAPHSRVRTSKLGTVKLKGGQRQVTYYGHRLYFYLGDHKPGSTDLRGEHYSKRDHGQWVVIDTGTGRIANSSGY